MSCAIFHICVLLATDSGIKSSARADKKKGCASALPGRSFPRIHPMASNKAVEIADISTTPERRAEDLRAQEAQLRRLLSTAIRSGKSF